MASLAELIGKSTTTDVALLQATVISLSAGTATIRFGGSNAAENIAGVRILSSASMAVGDTVWVVRNGDTLFILGRLSGSPNANPEFRDGVELYHPSSTPYIDFHTAANPAGDSNADYRWRMIVPGTDRIEFQAPGAAVKHTFWSDGEYWATSIGLGGDNTYNVGLMVHNGWIRVKGTYGLYWEDYGVGWTVSLNGYPGTRGAQILNYNECQVELYGGGVRWNDASMVTAMGGGGADVGYCVHHHGVRNGAVWLGWADGFWRIDGAGYTPGVYGDFIDTSSERTKRDIRTLEAGATNKAKVKALKPKRFKRLHDPGEKAKREREETDGVWKDQRWNAWVRAQEEADHVGFIAEDVLETIPEAVSVDVNGAVGGIRYGPIIAHLVGLVQELDDRLDIVERLPVVAMNKPKGV